jgi:hypothetical protein
VASVKAAASNPGTHFAKRAFMNSSLGHIEWCNGAL